MVKHELKDGFKDGLKEGDDGFMVANNGCMVVTRSERCTQPKVAQFETGDGSFLRIKRDKNVFWLEITMTHSSFVTSIDRDKNTSHDILGPWLGNTIIVIIKKLKHIGPTLLRNDVKMFAVVCSFVCLS